MLDPSNAAEWVITVAAVLTGLGVIAGVVYKYVWKPVKAFHQKVSRGMDTLLGYGAVVDPATGRVIQADTPPLANRVYDLEEAFKQVSNAVKQSTTTHNELLKLQRSQEERDKAQAERDREGLQIVHEWTRWREKHEEEADLREARLAEWNAKEEEREERMARWEQWRQEQTVLLEAMKAAQGLPAKDIEP